MLPTKHSLLFSAAIASEQSCNRGYTEARERMAFRNRCSIYLNGTLRAWRLRMLRLAGSVTLGEVSGSVGDLGSFLPVVAALVPAVGLDLGTTLIVTGCYNIVSGWAFGIPMCVQPMSTLSAIALTTPGLVVPEAVAAGVFVSATVLLLGLSGLMDWVAQVTPHHLVAAIQLAVGLKLAQQGLRQVVLQPTDAPPPPSGSAAGSSSLLENTAAAAHPVQAGGPWRPFWGLQGWGVGVAALLFLLTAVLSPAAPSPGASPGDGQDASATGSDSSQLLPASSSPRQQQQQQQQGEEGPDAARSTTPPTTEGAAPPAGAAPLSGIQAPGSAAAAASLAPASSMGCRSHGIRGSTQDLHLEQPLLSNSSSSRIKSCQPPMCSSNARMPAALLVVLLGMLVTCVSEPRALSELKLGPSQPQLVIPDRQQFIQGIYKAGLAQLPTTALNSVVAVTALAQQLFPDAMPSQAAAWRPCSVATSVGCMNLLGVWWGAWPCCHGAGGLAAQYSFGARSGAAPIILGSAKLLLGLLFGSSLFQLLQQFPKSLLGGLLMVAGLELARSVQRLNLDSQGFGVMLVTAVVMLGLGDVALGFLCGASLHVGLLLLQRGTAGRAVQPSAGARGAQLC